MSIMKNMSDKFSEKDKRNIRLALIAVVIIAVVFAIASIDTTGKDKTKAELKTRKGKFSLLTDQVEKESWIAAQGSNIKKLQQENEEFKRNIDGLQKEIEKLTNRQEGLENQAKTLSNSQSAVKIQKDGLLPPLPKLNVRQPAAGDQKPPRPSGNLKSVESIKIYSDSSSDGRDKDSRGAKGGEDKRAGKGGDKLTLSSGSFMKGVLLNGIDAPTDSSSKGEPYPVLINISDMANLPNHFKMNLKNCFIIGAGYGNLADERAYIRTEKISCVTESGKTIDTNLKGHIIGEDGKLGVRGTLVSKQGQLIAQTLLAGTLSGLSSAFKPQQSVSINLNSDGSSGAATSDMEDVFKSGGAHGVSSAMNKLAEFYLKMAEKIFPIIEISAGRKVDVLVLEQAVLQQSGSLNEETGG
jgi:conjugal transfer pilus assembly protein TraB